VKRSAGLLLFRRRKGDLEVFLVHPGGPFFARKDEGVWSIPKGEIDPGEEPIDVARREFEEETGRTAEACAPGVGRLLHLGTVEQRGGKIVEAWATEGDWPDGEPIHSNTFEMEWPPRSGRMQEFPEVDRGEFFPLAEDVKKINPAQAELIDRLRALL